MEITRSIQSVLRWLYQCLVWFVLGNRAGRVVRQASGAEDKDWGRTVKAGGLENVLARGKGELEVVVVVVVG